jgi:pyridoxine 5-phosphate synthase
VVRHETAVRAAVTRLKRAGIRTSLFIDPDEAAVRLSHAVAADAIELHTGSVRPSPARPGPAGRRSGHAAALAASLGLAVHAGHGLSVENVGPVAAIPEIEELNIGHAIVGRAIFVGLDTAVREIRAAMDEAREADLF